MELLLRAKEWMRNLKNSVCVCVCVKLTQAWVSLQRGALVVDKGVPKLGETPPPASRPTRPSFVSACSHLLPSSQLPLPQAPCRL